MLLLRRLVSDFFQPAKIHMIESTTGHIYMRREGDDLYLRCNSCGYEESIVGYEQGNRPQFITWLPTLFDREYAKCEKCGKVHDRVVPGAR